MGVLFLSYMAFTVAVAAYTIYAMRRASGTGQENMAPASLDSFSITAAQEGAVVRVIFGTVRIPGNILWYGNLKTEAIWSGGGADAGETDPVIIGYDYYLDVWQGLCQGKAEILKTYLNDDEESVQCADVVFNDGTGLEYPTEPGQWANRVPGVSHIFHRSFYLGENQTFVPTVHFVMRRILTSPVNDAVLPNGANPAAILYEVLRMGGAGPADFVLSSFHSAAAFWKAKGYGLNLDMARQQKVRNWVAWVFSYVDGALTINDDDQFVCKAFDPEELPVATLDTDDFLDFGISRRGWDDTFNFFRGNYIDPDAGYAKRTISAYNPANIRLTASRREKTVDLTAFGDVEAASRRLWEIMKRLSYPEAPIDFKTDLSWGWLQVGHVIEVNHEDYGIVSGEYRITEKDLSEVDSNEVRFVAEQMIETLFDDHFSVGGDSKWVTPSTDPGPLVHQRVFELPFNPFTDYGPAFLLLAARVHSYETGFIVLTSLTGTDYTTLGHIRTFSQRGALAEVYPSGTCAIDDDQGILYAPYREDPIFSTVSRTDLFGKARFALINDEIIRFESVTPEPGGAIRLKGCVRGCFNTPVSTHAINSEIWLCEILDNVLAGQEAGRFYVKFLPYFGKKVVDPADAAAMQVAVQNKAALPWPPGRIEAVRTGSSVQVTWWPLTKDFDGAGSKEEQAYTDTWPFDFDRAFEYRIDSGTWTAITGTQALITQAGAFTFSIRNVVDGRESGVKTLSVGAPDGTYIV